MIAAFILTTTTVWAAASMDVLKLHFSGDMSDMEAHVTTPLTSVSDGMFTLTLEQALVSQNRAVFIYSVEGVTKKASREVMNSLFNGDITIHQPGDMELLYGRMSKEELEDLRTKTKRYYTCSLESLNNPEMLPVSFSLNIMADETKTVAIPMDTTIQLLELTLSPPSGEEALMLTSGQMWRPSMNHCA